MLRIGICEDVPEELQKHKEMVQSIMTKSSKNIELFGFQSGEELLCEIETTGNMNIVLLDIEMLGMNGIETAKLLREKDTRAVLIFVSSYDQYCKEMIEVQPFAFIDKPVAEEKLENIIRYALETRFQFQESYHFSYHKMQYNISLADIRYFQSDKRMIYVDTVQKSAVGAEYCFYGKLEEVEKSVNEMSRKFLRIRKSFLVNTEFITEYAADKVILDNGTVIEISRNYKDNVRRHYISILREKSWRS